MGKAIIVNGADFSSNKLMQITFADVPCTGIAFSQSTFSLTAYGDTEIGYTVTPSNTTDSVTWQSSDTNVVTVSNGVMSVVGLGSCTVTATCGEFSATASVEVDIAWNSAIEIGQTISINTTLTPNIVNTQVNASRVVIHGSGNQASTYKSATQTGATALAGIKIPIGTSQIKIGATDTTNLYNSASSRVIWCQDVSSGNESYLNTIKPVSQSDTFSLKTEQTFNVPDDETNVFYVFARFTSDATQEMVEAAGIYVEFVLAE